MKKRYLSLLLALVLLAALLSGCAGASKSESAAYDTAFGNGEAEPQAPAEPPMPAGADYAAAETDALTSSGVNSAQLSESDKIIYSAYADIETLRFDETVEAVYDMIERYGGFLESSSITGNDYYTSAHGNKSYREASFSIRVPRESYSAVYGSLETLGNVPYKDSNAQNITAQYVDSESRLASYRTQEERLLELLEQAETVEDMITIEARLAEVRYEIESLTTTLRNWDSLVNYSSVTLHIREVSEITPESTAPTSYWDEVGEALSGTLRSVGRFFRELVKYFIALLPVLIIIAVIVAIVLIWRRSSKKSLTKRGFSSRAELRYAKRAERAAKKAAKNQRGGE